MLEAGLQATVQVSHLTHRCTCGQGAARAFLLSAALTGRAVVLCTDGIATLPRIPHVAALLLHHVQNVRRTVNGSEVHDGIVPDTKLRMVRREHIDVVLEPIAIRLTDILCTPLLVCAKRATVHHRGLECNFWKLLTIWICAGCAHFVTLPASSWRTTNCSLRMPSGTMAVWTSLASVGNLHGFCNCDSRPSWHALHHSQ